MDMKQAGAISLIAFVAACLAVLIARVLDSQAASQLEPKLDAIVQELQALREQGGINVPPGGGNTSGVKMVPASSGTLRDGLMVYYFHGHPCVTCRTMEKYTHETVSSDFSSQVGDGQMAWQVVDYREKDNQPLADKFGISTAAVVLVEMKGGEVARHKNLFRIWTLSGRKEDFKDYVRGEIQAMLKENAPVPDGEQEPPPLPDKQDSPPLPDTVESPLPIPE